MSARAAVAHGLPPAARKRRMAEAVQREHLACEAVLGAVIEAVLPALFALRHKDALLLVHGEGKARRTRIELVMPAVFARRLVKEIDVAARLFASAAGENGPARRKVERQHAVGRIHGVGGKVIARIGTRIVEKIVSVFEAAALAAQRERVPHGIVAPLDAVGLPHERQAAPVLLRVVRDEQGAALAVRIPIGLCPDGIEGNVLFAEGIVPARLEEGGRRRLLRPAEEGITLRREAAVGERGDPLIERRHLLHRAPRRRTERHVCLEAKGERLAGICKDERVFPRLERERLRRRKRRIEEEVLGRRRLRKDFRPLPIAQDGPLHIVAVAAGVLLAHFHRIFRLIARRHGDAVLRHPVVCRQGAAVKQPCPEEQPLLFGRHPFERLQKRGPLLGVHPLRLCAAAVRIQRDRGILGKLGIIGDARGGHDGGKLHRLPLAGAVEIPPEEHPALLFGRIGGLDLLPRLRRDRPDGRAAERLEPHGHAARTGGRTEERQEEHQPHRKERGRDCFKHLSQNSHISPPSMNMVACILPCTICVSMGVLPKKRSS